MDFVFARTKSIRLSFDGRHPNLLPSGRQIIDCPNYQGISSRSLKKPPVDPPSGNMASQIGVSAPC
jgi:hypothetical protein